MGRRNISIRQDLIASLRMVAGQSAVEAAKGRTDQEVRQMIEAAFVQRAA